MALEAIMGMKEEIDAMQTVATALNVLDDEAKSRVLRWAAEATKVPLGFMRVAPRTLSARIPAPTAGGGATTGAEATPYKTVADLVSGAAPRTTQDRVLAVAYWFQAVKTQADFTGQAVNTELKHLGHGVGNITKVLSALMHQQPALVMQIKKSGSAQQARKQYKLTQPGIDRVDGLLAGAAGGEAQAEA